MWPSVRASFVSFTESFEGKCSWMYLDVRGLVTTGIGNLIDPVGAALYLPFYHPDGTKASQGEIIAAWQTVKNRPDLCLRGGGAYASLTSLRLSDEGIAQLVLSRLSLNEARLKARFPDWETWPADAQMAVLSMAWAAGPSFNFPKFQAAALAQDWKTCAAECHMNDVANPGLRPRNVANVRLFMNADRVADIGLERSVLYYPQQATATQECAPGASA